MAIVWQQDIGAKYEQRLLTTILFADSDDIKNEDEALGKAIANNRKELKQDKSENSWKMTMNTVATSWNEPKKTDLSCLKYC